MSFSHLPFYWFGLYHFVLILFGTSLFDPSLYCPLSFSYSTTWSYKLFVLVLFWTSYFGPFSFCRLLFCPLILCPVCFLAFHYLVLHKFVLFHFVHHTMWKTQQGVSVCSSWRSFFVRAAKIVWQTNFTMYNYIFTQKKLIPEYAFEEHDIPEVVMG